MIRTRTKPKTDSFVLRNDNPLELLQEFLINRRDYIASSKTYKDDELVILENKLYLDVLERLIKFTKN